MSRCSVPLLVVGSFLLILSLMGLLSSPSGGPSSAATGLSSSLSSLRRDLAGVQYSYSNSSNSSSTVPPVPPSPTTAPPAPPTPTTAPPAAPTTAPPAAPTTAGPVPPTPTTAVPHAQTTARKVPSPAPTHAPAPKAPAPSAPTTTLSLCEQCDKVMAQRPDFTCDEISKYSHLDCTPCNCDNVDAFFRSPEFILIVIAACVAVAGGIFVGVCLCRRNRATGGAAYKSVTNGANEALLGGEEAAAASTTAAGVESAGQASVGSAASVSEKGAEWATVRYNFTADSSYEEQISVSKNDRVQVLEKFDDGWWNIKHEASGRVGIVPASYCTVEE